MNINPFTKPQTVLKQSYWFPECVVPAGDDRNPAPMANEPLVSPMACQWSRVATHIATPFLPGQWPYINWLLKCQRFRLHMSIFIVVYSLLCVWNKLCWCLQWYPLSFETKVVWLQNLPFQAFLVSKHIYLYINVKNNFIKSSPLRMQVLFTCSFQSKIVWG